MDSHTTITVLKKLLCIDSCSDMAFNNMIKTINLIHDNKYEFQGAGYSKSCIFVEYANFLLLFKEDGTIVVVQSEQKTTFNTPEECEDFVKTHF